MRGQRSFRTARYHPTLGHLELVLCITGCTTAQYGALRMSSSWLLWRSRLFLSNKKIFHLPSFRWVESLRCNLTGKNTFCTKPSNELICHHLQSKMSSPSHHWKLIESWTESQCMSSYNALKVNIISETILTVTVEAQQIPPTQPYLFINAWLCFQTWML